MTSLQRIGDKEGGELESWHAGWASTIGRPQLQHGHRACISSSELEASCAAEAFSHLASFIMHREQSQTEKTHVQTPGRVYEAIINKGGLLFLYVLPID